MRRQFIDSPIEPEVPVKPLQNFRIRAVLCLIIASLICGCVYYAGNVQLFKERLIFRTQNYQGNAFKKPELPDISGFTVESIISKVPSIKTGRIEFVSTKDYVELSKFKKGAVPRRLRLFQRRIKPRALVVAEGSYTWTSLYEAVQAIDPKGELIRKEGTKYLLRVPLLVNKGASLIISSFDTDEVRLSKQATVYLVNRGNFFIYRTTVTGWDEEKKEPSKYSGDKYDFRPFIVTWGGSNLYIAGSKIASLGYMKGKSYGLTFSTCLPCIARDPDIPPPTGVLIGNVFTDMYYAFYSYEAEDVAIIGNTYADNIVYGIDPHDRSRRLIIAGNEAYGTKQYHGIIISREVDDSWIFNNHSYRNNGSGIVLDRASVNNVIANNITEHNKKDGITIYESQNNVTWGNIIRNNGRNGVRIRNSWNIKMYNDILSMNRGASLEIYTSDISKDKTRDLTLDPFKQRASAYAHNTRFVSHGDAVFKITGAGKLSFSNIDVRTATYFFPQSLEYDRQAMFKTLNQTDSLVEMHTIPDGGVRIFNKGQ